MRYTGTGSNQQLSLKAYMERNWTALLNTSTIQDTRQKANVQNLNGQQLYGLLVGGGIINAAVLAGMLKTAAFVVPAAGAVGGAAKAYESPVIRNALLRLANTPKGSTAYDRAISTVTQSLTRVAQASQKKLNNRLAMDGWL